jgi:hypothetical protein
MKVLLESVAAPYTARIFVNNLKRVADVAEMKDMSQIPKALNEFKPDLLILKKENITGVVKAFCDKNNVKVIDLDSFEDIIVPIIDVVRFKDNSDKEDISVFATDPNQAFLVDFLSRNYNVKVYGQKINSPRYLGELSRVEKYEVINKSKLCVVFNPVDEYESVLLDTHAVAYGQEFNTIVSLIECIDNVSTSKLADKKENYKTSNDITFSIDTLTKLGFNEEAKILEVILKETLAC